MVVVDFLEEFVRGELFKIVGKSKLNNFCCISGKFIVWEFMLLEEEVVWSSNEFR